MQGLRNSRVINCFGHLCDKFILSILAHTVIVLQEGTVLSVARSYSHFADGKTEAVFTLKKCHAQN